MSGPDSLPLSNRLTVLAGRIGDAAQAVRAASREAAEKALETGRLLIAAKAECEHGQWLPLLESAGVAERQGQRLMTLARSGLKSDTVSDLGIKGALRLAGARRLPLPGHVLVVSDGPLFADPNSGYAWVWESRHPQCFHVAGMARDGVFAEASRKPVPGDYPEIVFRYVDSILEDRQSQMQFKTLMLPLEVLERFGLAVIEDQASDDLVDSSIAVIEEAIRRLIEMGVRP